MKRPIKTTVHSGRVLEYLSTRGLESSPRILNLITEMSSYLTPTGTQPKKVAGDAWSRHYCRTGSMVSHIGKTNLVYDIYLHITTDRLYFIVYSQLLLLGDGTQSVTVDEQIVWTQLCSKSSNNLNIIIIFSYVDVLL